MLSPYTGSLVGRMRTEQPQKAVSLKLRGRGDAQKIQHRRGYVDQAGRLVTRARRSCGAPARPMENQGHPQRTFVDEIAVGLLAMLAQALAVIGSEDDESVCRESSGRERLLEAADGFVDVGDFGIVAAVRVWLVRVIQMDEGEKRMPGFRLDPVARRTEHGIGGPLDLRRLLAGIRPKMKRAVVDVESAGSDRSARPAHSRR